MNEITFRTNGSGSPSELFPRMSEVLKEGLGRGLHLGGQGYISCRGKVLADFSIGEKQPGDPLEPDDLLLWMSASKPFAAVAIATLWEQNKLGLDDPIIKFIPEFGQGGKEPVTLRHVLTHTGGFRHIELPWVVDWDEAIKKICAHPLEADWVIGKKAGYHVTSGWYILGEVIHSLSGIPYSQFIRKNLFEAFGMTNTWVGMPADVFRANEARICPMHHRVGGKLRPVAWSGTQETCGVCRPGANGYGPIRELGRFYESLLAGGIRDGKRVLLPQTVEVLTARHRVGLYDHTFRTTAWDMGLGFVIDSKYASGKSLIPYGFGEHASPRTFGHGGYLCANAFADPEVGLVVAWVLNGMCGPTDHNHRNHALNTAIYEDLNEHGTIRI